MTFLIFFEQEGIPQIPWQDGQTARRLHCLQLGGSDNNCHQPLTIPVITWTPLPRWSPWVPWPLSPCHDHHHHTHQQDHHDHHEYHHHQVIQWMQDPTPVSQMESFQPWSQCEVPIPLEKQVSFQFFFITIGFSFNFQSHSNTGLQHPPSLQTILARTETRAISLHLQRMPADLSLDQERIRARLLQKMSATNQKQSHDQHFKHIVSNLSQN